MLDSEGHEEDPAAGTNQRSRHPSSTFLDLTCTARCAYRAGVEAIAMMDPSCVRPVIIVTFEDDLANPVTSVTTATDRRATARRRIPQQSRHLRAQPGRPRPSPDRGKWGPSTIKAGR